MATSRIKPKGRQVAHVSKHGLKPEPLKRPIRIKGNKNTAVTRDYSYARTS